MKRIILHWTAGANQPCNTDLQHYHYLINKDGIIIKGKFPVSANEVCKTDKSGNALYAAHCGGGNTGSIGVSMCGMYVPAKSDIKNTKFPLTKIQCEVTFKLVAELCKKYNLPVNNQTVMTHYEFGKTHPNTLSAGKIDIIYLPPYPEVKQAEIGDFIRNKVKWYLSKI